MAALYYIANVGLKIRLIASLVRLSEDKAINPEYSDKIRHFGSTVLTEYKTCITTQSELAEYNK